MRAGIKQPPHTCMKTLYISDIHCRIAKFYNNSFKKYEKTLEGDLTSSFILNAENKMKACFWQAILKTEHLNERKRS